MKLTDRILDRMFGHPEGLLGVLGGRILARGKENTTEWVLSLIGLESDDHVLEVGIGPGVSIQHAARSVPDGFVVGVDTSEVMLAQARDRNQQAIEAGQVTLAHESASSLPYGDDAFDAAFTINSMQVWSDVRAGARELCRVVKADGTIAIAFTKQARAEQLAADLPDLLADIGVSRVHSETRDSDTCVIATV
jgi:ubiquinone/menaquinone biosynthesis C-methylase UbiE